jgi:hypothetical protein
MGSLTSFLRKVIVIILVDDLVGNLMTYFLVPALTYIECAKHAQFKAFDMQNQGGEARPVLPRARPVAPVLTTKHFHNIH